MTLPAKTLLAALLLVAGAAAIPASACRVLGPEEAARRQQEAVAETKAQLLALKDEADLVFVGRIAMLTSHEETLPSTSPIPHLVQVYGATFDLVEHIKGKYAAQQVLSFTRDKTRVVVGCGTRDVRDSLPRANGTGDMYLVYARAGKILRANRMPEWELMNGRQEAEFLRAAK